MFRRVLASAGVLLAAGAGVVGCAPQPAHPAGKPLAVFIGDSYTQGAGATDQAHGFASLVAKAEGWQILNVGHGGTGYVTSNLDGINACGLSYCGDYGDSVATVAVRHPQIVVVSGGVNDSTQPAATFASAVDQFMASLDDSVGSSTTVYVTSPQWPGTDVPAALTAEEPVLKAAAARHGFRYLDIGQPLAGRDELLFTDHFHPNNAGHLRLAKAIEQHIAE